MVRSGRNVIIGLDGVPFAMIEDFAESAVMPNLGEIIKDGYFSAMRSSIPDISSVAWSSIITGVNPAEHGIFGFIDLHPDSYKMRFPNFRDLKAKPFWEHSDKQSVIINVPSTYPVRNMDGVHISGFVSIDYEKSVYPMSLQADLKDLGYRLDVDSMLAHESMDLFVADIEKTLEGRIKAYEYLWDIIDWHTFMLVFTATDRLMHFLYNAYEQSGHKYHQFFLDHFHRIDSVIGRIKEQLGEDDSLILLSDHGFERLDWEVYLNNYLKAEGFLSFSDPKECKLENISAETKAFVLDPGRIYINMSGKYPGASVGVDEVESVEAELVNFFEKLEIEGRKVIKHIYKKSEVYAGAYFGQAPDIVLIAEKGFNLKGAMGAKNLYDKGPFSGKHSYDDAFIVLRDKSAGDFFADEKPTVTKAGRYIRSLAAGDE